MVGYYDSGRTFAVRVIVTVTIIIKVSFRVSFRVTARVRFRDRAKSPRMQCCSGSGVHDYLTLSS